MLRLGRGLHSWVACGCLSPITANALWFLPSGFSSTIRRAQHYFQSEPSHNFHRPGQNLSWVTYNHWLYLNLYLDLCHRFHCRGARRRRSSRPSSTWRTSSEPRHSVTCRSTISPRKYFRYGYLNFTSCHHGDIECWHIGGHVAYLHCRIWIPNPIATLHRREVFTLHGVRFRFPSLWLIHTSRDWEMIGFYIAHPPVHTTQGQGHGTIVFYCAHPGPGPVQYV